MRFFFSFKDCRIREKIKYAVNEVRSCCGGGAMEGE